VLEGKPNLLFALEQMLCPLCYLLGVLEETANASAHSHAQNGPPIENCFRQNLSLISILTVLASGKFPHTIPSAILINMTN
jgi:hypothetical protein